MSLSLIYHFLYIISERIFIPTIFIDLIFVTVLILYIVLTILNVENSREM